LIKNGGARKEKSLGLKCKDREKLNRNSVLKKFKWPSWRKGKRKDSSCQKASLRPFLRNSWFGRKIR